NLQEVRGIADSRTHWLRGDFPERLLAGDDAVSMAWREYFIQTYLERDLPLPGLSANPLLTRRLWTMLAHWNGNLLNYEALGNTLGITGATIRRYLDFFESAYLIRRIQPWFLNISKSLVSSPKVYIRITGILHALLACTSYEQLLVYPTVGSSWEAYVIQEAPALRIVLLLHPGWHGSGSGAGPGRRSGSDGGNQIQHAPAITKSMRLAAADLQTRRNIIIAPVEAGYSLQDGFEVMGNREIESWI
ncbi:MAG: ATP-binding protein, partial [Saprospiraceae bacterium]